MTNIVHNYPLWNNGRVVIKHGAYVGPRVVINHSTLTLLVWTEEENVGEDKGVRMPIWVSLTYVLYCPLYHLLIQKVIPRLSE